MKNLLKGKYGLYGLFLVFLALQGLPVAVRAESASKTAFSVVEGILDFPGLNVEGTIVLEGKKYGTIGKGYEVSVLTIAKVIDVSFGKAEDLDHQWSATTLSPSVKFSNLKDLGLDFHLPLPDSFKLGIWIGFDSTIPEPFRLDNILGGFKITLLGVKF